MQKAAQNLISAQTADRLIAAHDGNVALLFLWLSRNEDMDAACAARDLCLTLSEVRSAYEKLCRMELCDPKPKKLLPPADELPEYTAEDVVRRAKSDPAFRAVLDEAELRLCRQLSSVDIKTLFGIYDHLALPPDVIFMLLTHCIEVFREKYGSERQPSMRSIEKEAYAWANREILTIEQAEEFIKNYNDRRGAVGMVKAELGITGRQLTPTETKYIDSWLDMGFNAETLALAYDRTVTNTGALKWNYMNKIILSWHEKGLHTPAEIEEKDRRQPANKPQSGKTGAATSDDLGRLRSIYNKVKNG